MVLPGAACATTQPAPVYHFASLAWDRQSQLKQTLVEREWQNLKAVKLKMVAATLPVVHVDLTAPKEYLLR